MYINVAEHIFDDQGWLKPYTPLEWSESWIEYIEEFDDDIPFQPKACFLEFEYWNEQKNGT